MTASRRPGSSCIWPCIAILLIGVIAGFVYANTSSKGTQDLPSAPRANSRTIAVSVDNWKFSPSTIRVKKDEKVTLTLTGVNGVHGFAATQLGINEQILPGQTVSIELPTNKAGTFEFFCSVACGPGHAEMIGQIIIE